MNFKLKVAIAALGTAALIGAVVPSVSAGKPDRQHHNGYYCDPLVTNGNHSSTEGGLHWGWECTGTVPTPVVTTTPVVTVTPEPTSTPAPEVTSTPTPPVATPTPEKPGNPGSQAVGCWVDGCPDRGPVVRLLPPAVFVPGAPVVIPAGDLPAPEPTVVPLPPRAGNAGYADQDDIEPAFVGVLVVLCALGGYLLGRSKV